MYHPEIVALNSTAMDLYAEGRRSESTLYQLKAGALQQKLIRPNGRRYLHAQWCWSYGHIGMMGQLIRWFRKTEPGTELILEDQGRANNQYFLKVLSPFLTIVDHLRPEMKREAENNAVYFGCPDGKLSIHNFYKMVERECEERLPLEVQNVDSLLSSLGVKRPYIALHARNFGYDPSRNITLRMAQDVIGGQDKNIISIGLDQHPVNDFYPNVLDMPNPWLASFQLSAECERFIGSNSGAWTVANAYGRPVELMNDHEHKSWIYPEEIEE